MAVTSPEPLGLGVLKQITLPTLLKTLTVDRFAVLQFRNPAGGPWTVNLTDFVLALIAKVVGVATATVVVEVLGEPVQLVFGSKISRTKV